MSGHIQSRGKLSEKTANSSEFLEEVLEIAYKSTHVVHKKLEKMKK
jgi:hypothetical protein